MVLIGLIWPLNLSFSCSELSLLLKNLIHKESFMHQGAGKTDLKTNLISPLSSSHASFPSDSLDEANERGLENCNRLSWFSSTVSLQETNISHLTSLTWDPWSSYQTFLREWETTIQGVPHSWLPAASQLDFKHNCIFFHPYKLLSKNLFAEDKHLGSSGFSTKSPPAFLFLIHNHQL